MKLTSFFKNRYWQWFIKQRDHELLSKNPQELATFLTSLIERYIDSMPADEALRFLFRLDARLYGFQGRKSVEYGGGVHTKHRHTRYHDFFVNHIQKSERVLDIGCGNGSVAHDVAVRTGASVLGIDLVAANIDAAQKKFSHPAVRYMLGDVLKDLPKETFDVVILSNVLEHLPEREHFLRRVQEAANPKRFLIRVPVFERDWRVPLKKELGVEWRLDDTHETEYTLESFADEMSAAGMEVLNQQVRWGEIWAEVRAREP